MFFHGLHISILFDLQNSTGCRIQIRVTQIGNRNIAAYTGSRNQFAGFASDNNPLYYYFSYANNAFGSTLGFEATLETFAVKNWSYRISYSLSQTTSGNFGPSIVYPDDTRGYSTRNFTGEFLASWDRTHNLRALIQYFFEEGEGPELFGIKPLANSVISLTYTAQSGLPYTYVTDFDLRDVVFNRRYPIESVVDFNFIKNIDISDYKIIIGLRVMNLFDNKWITPMSTNDDISLWVEESVTMMDAGNDPLRFSHLIAPYRAYSNIPRQVLFTVGFGF